MKNLKTKITKIFDENVKDISNNKKHISCSLISDNLITKILCDSKLYFNNLKKLSLVFNTSLKASRVDSQTIKAFITENKKVFQKIKEIFQDLEWSTKEKSVKLFNIVTKNTSKAKCTIDKKFYIIKCYDYFYYIYDTETNTCLIVISDDKKAVTMVNILLLTPYLLFGDLYAIHGGLVSDGRNNILISGTSLAGKTTFALLFLENGWQIITEESTYITKYGKIFKYNIRNYFNIRVGTYLEFKDLFIKKGVINDSFLSMIYTNQKKLFKIRKEMQLPIYFEDLCKNNNDITTNRITHFLKVSIEKDKSGMIIKKISPMEIVDKFLEISFAPTVMLFKNFTNVVNSDKNKIKKELTKIFKNVKSYSVISGLDYKKHFRYLLNKII